MIKLNSVRHEVAGALLFENISVALAGPKRYGLVGPNGVGKTTLAKIMAGEISPASGTVSADSVLYFAQSEVPAEISLAEYLSEVWDSPGASDSWVAKLTAGLDFSRSLRDLSGGEWMRARLALCLSRSPSFLILDEPSNNLDREGKAGVLRLLREFSGGVLLISHDRELLAEVETVLELSNQGISVYGGNFETYWEARESERQGQLRRLEKQKKTAQKLEREKIAKFESQEKRMRTAAAGAADSGLPKILLGQRKRKAQASLGKVIRQEGERVESATQKTTKLWLDAKLDPFVRLNFSAVEVPANQVLVSAENLQWTFAGSVTPLWPRALSFQVRGPQRWQILGANGSGKSTLLKLILHQLPAGSGRLEGRLVTPERAVAYLDQSYRILDPTKSVLDNILGSSRLGETELRNELAFYGFRGDQVFQKIESLSGGEKLKAGLAKIFLGASIPELLILDEPTNNLDLGSLGLLEAALRNFRGALILVCHDAEFTKNLEVTHTLNLMLG